MKTKRIIQALVDKVNNIPRDSNILEALAMCFLLIVLAVILYW